jgi:1-acyl-sn-glycerol-3-phosphate acyltransferase
MPLSIHAMNPIQLVRSLIFLCAVPVVTASVCILVLIDFRITEKTGHKGQIYPRLWARILTRIAGVRIRVEGMDQIDPEATYVFAGNHSSQFDIYAFQAAFPHDFRWIAKKELFQIPLFGPAMRKVGFISIDRSHGRKALKSLNLAAQRIADGASVLIFPEGTRSRDGRLHPFKAGAILLAIRSGVPVVPIGFNGADRVLPKGALLPRGGEIVLRVGRPIPTNEYSTRDKQKLAAILHDRVAELLDRQHLPEEQVKQARPER